MALNLSNEAPLPPATLIYGPNGVGKTTFLSMAEKPVMIDIEGGKGALNVASFPRATSWEMVRAQLGELCTEEHEFKTLGIDTIDWLETLFWDHIANENNVSKIDDIPYGKGYGMALNLWHEFYQALDFLRRERDMAIVLIGHSDIKRYDDPGSDPYDRYTLRLHKSAAGLALDYPDIVTFANYHISTTEKDMGFNQKRTRAVGSSARFLHFVERPAFIAKNRFDLPEKIPFDRDGKCWATIIQNIPYYGVPAEQPSQPNRAKRKN